jgi:hypothetical protein
MNNPQPRVCQALFRAYCLRGNNMDDTRCREALRKWCKEHPDNKHCVPFVLQRSRKYCETNSGSRLCRAIATDAEDFCKKYPNNAGCAKIKQLVQDNSRLFRKISPLRDRLKGLENTTTVDTGVTSADVGG